VRFVRVASIDIGTNTVSLLVADVGVGRALSAVVDREAITRLGETVDRTRVLDAGAVARTLACLADFAREIAAARCDAVAVVGTSALRDALGGEAFRERARAIVGVEVRVLSGHEEAAATFSGATSDRVEKGTRVVFDIGGGSTEIVVGDAASESVSFATSLDIGSVRLTERLIHSDPPSGGELDAVARAVDEALASIPSIASLLAPIGVAGTMTTLASIALALPRYEIARIHGSIVPTDALEGALTRLQVASTEERRALPAMVAARADVIVAGGHIGLALLRRLGASSVVVSDRGVRWGLARQLARDATVTTI
jgi:exopolyphosphatase/guanosine-5'-triphosphate,3'-diphosphate pyrophosphatase